MKKVIRDNKVAVVISAGFGAGWFTWSGGDEELLFHPNIVKMVEDGKAEEIDEAWIENNLGIKEMYCGGTDGLTIQWVEKNKKFRVEEYDGAEYIITEDELYLEA